MHRRGFLEKLVPGLKNLRQAAGLREAYEGRMTEDTAAEISTEVQKGWFKISVEAAIGLALVFGAPTAFDNLINWNKKKRKYIELEIRKVINLSEEVGKFNICANYLNENGEIEPHTPENRKPYESGAKFGFFPRKRTVKIPIRILKLFRTEEEIEFKIDSQNFSIQPMSKDQAVGEAFKAPLGIFIGEKYIKKHNIDHFILMIPISYQLGDETISFNFELSSKIRSPDPDQEKVAQAFVDSEVQVQRVTNLNLVSKETLSNLETVIDKNSKTIFQSQSPENTTIEIGEGGVVLGSPKNFSGKNDDISYEINSNFEFQLLDADGKVIESSGFHKSMLISTNHLKNLGAKKIVLYMKVNVTIGNFTSPKQLSFEFEEEDFSKLTEPITFNGPNGKITLTP